MVHLFAFIYTVGLNGDVSIHNTIYWLSQDSLSYPSKRLFSKLLATPYLPAESVSHDPQRSSLIFSPLILTPCQTNFCGLRKEKNGYAWAVTGRPIECVRLPYSIGDNIASTKTEDARRLKWHFAIVIEDAIPCVEQDFTANISHRKITEWVLYQWLQTLRSKK